MATLRRLACAGAAVLALGAGAARADQLVSVRVGGADAPVVDPASKLWAKAKPVTVAVQAQQVTTPQLAEASVGELTVRSLHNAKWVSFLIEWKDDTVNDVVNVKQFGDQVAVELPNAYTKDSSPNPMMGAADEQVTIMQWRATFQRDIDKGPLRLHDLYPNAHVDLYPDMVLKGDAAAPYTGAKYVNNPVATTGKSPVLDYMARGFGSLTAKPDQVAQGKGVHKDGMWHVVIARPLKAGSEADPDLKPGSDTVAAFAVWDGGHGEVGARKAWSDWVPLSITESVTE